MKNNNIKTYHGKFCRVIEFENKTYKLLRYTPIGITIDIIKEELTSEKMTELIKDIDEQMLQKYQMAFFHEVGLLPNKRYHKLARKIWEEYKHSPQIYKRPEEKDLKKKIMKDTISNKF